MDQNNNITQAENLDQKLKLLIENAGAPTIVKDSLLKELKDKGATVKVMDKIIQAFNTEKDILALTVNSITNLKSQLSEGSNNAQSPQPAQQAAPAPRPQQPAQPQQNQPTAQTQPKADNTTQAVANTNVQDQGTPQPQQQVNNNAQPQAESTENAKDEEELNDLLTQLKELQAKQKNQAGAN
jgi:hypothetical protein